MPDRIIFHADCNNFYASCEILERPELRDVPMAVAGDPEKRVGVVVAKNEVAKRYGIKTTDTVYQAKKKCPEIVFVPPRHYYYSEISRRVNEIYLRYTEYVEPASIDESFLDMTQAVSFLQQSPPELADELRDRGREEIGITISVGVSYCKGFAKMGSDYKKPNATTVITRENFKDILWPLPVSDLFMAGKAAVAAMEKKYIRTIGDLARQSQADMHGLLGKHGDMTIYIDADACPVTRIVERVAREHDIPVMLLCDTNHVLSSDYSTIKVIGAGADAVDIALIAKLKPPAMLGRME